MSLSLTFSFETALFGHDKFYFLFFKNGASSIEMEEETRTVLPSNLQSEANHQATYVW